MLLLVQLSLILAFYNRRSWMKLQQIRLISFWFILVHLPGIDQFDFVAASSPGCPTFAVAPASAAPDSGLTAVGQAIALGGGVA